MDPALRRSGTVRRCVYCVDGQQGDVICIKCQVNLTLGGRKGEREQGR